MTSYEAPTGYVRSEETATVGGSAAVRWLGPRRPRRAAAVLLLVAAAVTFWVTDVWLARSFSSLPTGSEVAMQVTPVVSGAVVTLALAVFVLGGSPASRVLGGVAATAGLLSLLVPAVVLGLPPADLGPAAAVWLAAVALHLATLVALVLPTREPAHPDGGA